MDNPCWIIGVLDAGPDHLVPAARERLAKADRVFGEDRFLALFSALIPVHAQTRSFSGKLKALPAWIRSEQEKMQRVVVLATGDPLFFGVADYLSTRLPPGSWRVLGTVSTLQQAFAAFAISWKEARLLSVHQGDGGDWQRDSGPDHPLYELHQALRQGRTIGLFTGPANGPGRVIRMLITLGLASVWRLHVAERLGTPHEKLLPDLAPQSTQGHRFHRPNVVILTRDPALPEVVAEPLLGLPDAFFVADPEGRGLVTKQEVRVLVLSALRLRQGDVVWDLGAGSGSVGLEAARLCSEGRVYAVEQRPERGQRIRENRFRLGVANYELVIGQAPEAIGDWPDPNAVFIGGSGGQLGQMIRFCGQRLRPGGRLVMSFVTLENFQEAVSTLKGMGLGWQVTQIQVARSRPIQGKHRFIAESPVWIVQSQTGTGGMLTMTAKVGEGRFS